MRDIGLFGLGIVEEHSRWVWDNANVPSHEDEAIKQSITARTINGMDAVW
jgi:hypothetical protein